ncbi:hypothetical protein C8R45DRAFT_1025381 [Mycena sanguinolenta]|nr:hypothetical protein C8R45DRAFT_1025381 [Mycena sanguinolenta]
MRPFAACPVLKALIRVRPQSSAVLRAGNRGLGTFRNKIIARAFSHSPTLHERNEIFEALQVTLKVADLRARKTELASTTASAEMDAQIDALNAEEAAALQSLGANIEMLYIVSAPIILDASLTTLSFAAYLIAIRDSEEITREEALALLHKLGYIHEAQVPHIPKVLPASNIDILELASSLLSQIPAQQPQPFSSEELEELFEVMGRTIPSAEARLAWEALLKAQSMPDDEITLGQFLSMARWRAGQEKDPATPHWQEARCLWEKVMGTQSLDSTNLIRKCSESGSTAYLVNSKTKWMNESNATAVADNGVESTLVTVCPIETTKKEDLARGAQIQFLRARWCRRRR